MMSTPVSQLLPPTVIDNSPFSLSNAPVWKTGYIFTPTTSDQKAKEQSWVEFGRKKEAAQIPGEESPRVHLRRSPWL